MKNTYIKIITIFLATLAIVSCEDEEKNPHFVQEDASNEGVFVTIAKQTDVIDFTDSTSSYDFIIDAPSTNVAGIDISVQRVVDGVGGPLAPIRSGDSFPATFSVTTDDIATALGVAASSFGPGDQFDFVSTVTGTDDSVTTIANLNGASTGPGQFQGFNHTTFLSCPFVVSEAVGTYTVIDDGFGLANSTFEIVAGPDDSTVTVVGMYSGDFDISVNTKTGIATIPRQPVEPSFFGYAGGNINTSSTSFFFSCAGSMVFSVQYTVDLGSFGSGIALIAQKN